METVQEEGGRQVKRTKDFYNLEATPAEGTTYRLAKIDKKLYPDIIAARFDG